jgi:hypothetical protein
MDNRYLDGSYRDSNPTWHEEDAAWKAQQILRMIQRHDLRPGSVCEVGCGSGEVIHQLHAQLPNDVNFVGYDISPDAHEIAKGKVKDRLRFVLKDLLEESGTSWDLVLALDVFEHVDDYLGFLRRLSQIGRRTIFHIPLDISVMRVLLSKPILRRRESVGHLHYFTKETALATLADAGYEIIDYFYTASSLELPVTAWVYALGRLPLRFARLLNQDLAVRVLGGHSLLVLAKPSAKLEPRAGA